MLRTLTTTEPKREDNVLAMIKEIDSNSVLPLNREKGTSHDPYAVVVAMVTGHMPCAISSLVPKECMAPLCVN